MYRYPCGLCLTASIVFRRMPRHSSFFRVLLQAVPDHIRLMMLSREVPPLDIHEFKMKHQAFVLNNEELAFSFDETAKYIRKIHNLSLSSSSIAHIHEVTEGWIGSLVLLCESLHQIPERLRDRRISDDVPERFRWEIFQYFGEKMFSLMPRDVQDFLIRASVLDIIDPAFAGESIGTERAHEILEDLTRRNLFVQSFVDNSRGWKFRFHQLFRDFLQARFRTLDKHRRLSSYLEAAVFCEEQEESAGRPRLLSESQ